MCNGVLHASSKYMGQFTGLVELCKRNCLLRGSHAALALQRRHFHHHAAQGVSQLLQVDLVSVLAHQVDHIDCHDDWQPQLDQLGG